MTYTLATTNDLIDNPSPRCACMLVLDNSGSMSGKPIYELNQGVNDFFDSLKQDDIAACSVEVSVITAGGHVREELPFTTAMNINSHNSFSANGSTPLGEAVNLALQKLEERKRSYQKAGVAYYQPWLVIISDGAPTDSWQTAAAQSRQLSENRKLVSLAIGVQGADLNILGQFSSRPAKTLQGLKFREFFQWLSASMSRVSASASTSSSVNLPPTTGWDSI